MNKPKLYIGDAVYAEVRMGELILTTEDGLRVTNIIVLEPEIWHTLKEFMKS